MTTKPRAVFRTHHQHRLVHPPVGKRRRLLPNADRLDKYQIEATAFESPEPRPRFTGQSASLDFTKFIVALKMGGRKGHPMIYEMRTCDLEPRTVPEVEKRFGEAYEKRRKYSELAAFWHTEIGMLNQIVQVWPYKDLEERARVRAAVVRDKVWPPDIREFIVKAQADIMIPFSISPELKPARMGPFFELRTYTYFAGGLPLIMKNWENAIDVRLKFGPVCALWYSELGALNKFIHIWPYKSLNERMEIRSQAEATGLYLPNVKAVKEGGKIYPLFSMENKILMPSAFSPLQ